jgi:hypothetical protein
LLSQKSNSINLDIWQISSEIPTYTLVCGHLWLTSCQQECHVSIDHLGFMGTVPMMHLIRADWVMCIPFEWFVI